MMIEHIDIHKKKIDIKGCYILYTLPTTVKPGGVAIFLHEPNKRGNEICYAVIKGIYSLPAVFVRFLWRISKKEVTHHANVHPSDVYPYSYQFEQIAKNIGFLEVFTETEGFTWCIIRAAILPVFNYAPRKFSVLLKPMYKFWALFALFDDVFLKKLLPNDYFYYLYLYFRK